MGDGADDESGRDETPTVADTPRSRGVDVQLPSRFTVKRTLGEGGMGSVVEAYDRVLSRDVAIKILARDQHADPNVGARFLREARAAARLRHPSIVQVHDVDPDGGYIVMELVNGESLSARLWRDKRLPVDEVRRIGTAMLRGLAAAHAEGIVHRDVKPANVLLGAAGEVKLADFGVAYFGDSELTMPGTRVGTPAYMAPEQLRGKDIDARADVYAAGVTLFEAAIGERPSDDVDAHYDELVAATNDAVLARAITRAIRERPGERFADAAAFADALDQTEVPTLLPSATMRRRMARWSKPRVVAFVAAAAVIGASAAGLAVHFATRASTAPAVAHRTIALLPFVDSTQNPMLDFAAAGLPNLLGLELHGVSDVAVIGYYQLLDVAGRGAPHDAWLAAARKLGADVIVGGELTGAGAIVHVAIAIDDATGTRLATIERDLPIEQVPDGVRRAAPALVRVALGRDVAEFGTAPTSFAADRELQLGIAELDREHLHEANDHLEAAIHHAPGNALAHYYLALSLSWNVPPAEPALAEIDRAVATGKLDEAQRGLLAALAKSATLDYIGGLAMLRPLAEKFPDDRQILYTMFEAMFHGGRPAEAMTVYRHIHALAPKFRLALVHVFTFYIAHGDKDGIAWALGLNDSAGDTYDPLWEPRVLMSRREYSAAIDLLSRQIAATKGDRARVLQQQLVIVYALSGQLELASALAAQLGETGAGGPDPIAMLGLATLRGDAAARGKWLDATLRAFATAPVGPGRSLPLILLVAAELPVASPDELARLDKLLAASLVSTYERALNFLLAQVVLADALHDGPRLATLARSPYAEVAQLAVAAIARGKGDRATAITATRRSIAATGDARYLADQWWQLAGDLRATGDRAATIAACDEVLHPRLALTWAWASATADCLAWTAEANEALGDVAGARAAWTRLIALRTAASRGDPAIAAARAALARLAAK